MNIRRTLGVVLGAALALGIAVPAARASMRNEATKVTFGAPVQVPGVVLPAGTYWFEETALPTGIVKIVSSDWSKVYATVSTLPVDRRSWAGRGTWDGHGQIVLAKGTAGQPDTVLDWFYPAASPGINSSIQVIWKNSCSRKLS
jgi:hypothetical protein